MHLTCRDRNVTCMCRDTIAIAAVQAISDTPGAGFGDAHSNSGIVLAVVACRAAVSL